VNNVRFDALVRRLEPQCMTSPRLYKARVMLLALLGYAYIGAILTLLLGALAGSIWAIIYARGGNGGLAQIAIALGALTWVVGKALWVRVEPPKGRVLRREEAPALFAEVEELRRALQAPRADVILLTDDCNAAVTQVPRLGIFGFPRNYLSVGLPLLTALPASHVRAVLAHEFAHLSHAHGKFMTWVYRVRQAWYQLMAHFGENPSWFARVFRWFFDWYAGYFGAYTFVLLRRHEYEADRLAAAVVGPVTMAQTLVDLDVRDRFVTQRFWPSVWAEADAREAPPSGVYERMAASAREPLPAADADAWVAAAFRRRTDTDDTHPALRDRVAALVGGTEPGRLPDGTPLRATPSVGAPAAAHYFGRAYRAIAKEMSGIWQAAADASWEHTRLARSEARDGIAALTAKAAAEPLDVEERWQLADWTETIHGADAALPMLEALLHDEPEHVSALFSTGRLLLDRRDERGIALIDQAMDREAGFVVAGCGLVCNFLANEGRLEEANRYRERGSVRVVLLQDAERERTLITPKDTYVPSDLPPETVQEILDQLDRFEHVGRAYLARKVVRHFADEAPVHVLVVLARHRWYWMDPKKQLAQAEAITQALALPLGVNAFALSPMQGEILKPLTKVAGSLVYDAAKRKVERQVAQLQPAEEALLVS
jgi:Zn-dependent protease with chaperone function